MATKQWVSDQKALVTVFDDVASANLVVAALHQAGFPIDKIELVTHDMHLEAPEVETPRDHPTTASSLVDGATKWAGIGAGAGAIAGLLMPVPGLAIATTVIGGLAGAAVGGIAGIDHALEDDSVDLPTLEEYEHLIKNGETIVVVLGTHEEVMRAEELIKKMYEVRSHIHPLHGHKFHEHPARTVAH